MKMMHEQIKGLKISKMSLSNIMISILIFYCILFPADKINIKEILLILTIITCYLNIKNFRIQRNIFFNGIVWPILSVVYALIRGVAIGSAMSYGYVWVFLLILPEIWRKKIDLKPPFILATYIVALVIDFIMLCDVFGVISVFSNPVANFFIAINEIPQVGKGALATFGYSIFYKSCPLILVTQGYLIYKKKYFFCLPLMIALLGCGTRANFFMVLFISIAIPLLCSENKSKKLVVLLVVFVVGLYITPLIVNKMSALNALKYGRSDEIKMADMNVVLSCLKENYFNLFFGTGVGSAFLSPRGEVMTTFELSYIDLLRQSGLVGIFVFFLFIIKPIIISWVSKRWLFVCSIAYLAVSFTNPLLVTSTSFMLYLLLLSEVGNKDLGCQ